ncbi:MAG TPA: sugar O-acetyltransferase [Candidatus Alectryocaccomicrobium excrementavium]|uniref:Acetyltransferase n=1 Tax=Candidatus Alectryocaccomicrobium excrementavium TaxID=2840668 RepID=A0A9D1K4R0_9FIRM|nr:sugar O-acetyltransferase [Candidatus Alectryocaccomicrobium excrementavium]
MREEERLLSGIVFMPGAPELRAIKLATHNLNNDYNATYEDETEKRAEILHKMLGEMGEGTFLQGPIYFHYGKHTKIGKRVFINFNFTVQDDALVTIGDDCNFGPNVTIVTPVHPMLANERRAICDKDGVPRRVCYAKPVHIGRDCWFGANVVVCPGVTIGDNCVIGAGSVVTRDVPANTFAAGNPCRVIRELTEADSMAHKPAILADYQILPADE